MSRKRQPSKLAQIRDDKEQLAALQEKSKRAPMTTGGHESTRGFKQPTRRFSASCRHCYGSGFTIWQGQRTPCVQCSS